VSASPVRCLALAGLLLAAALATAEAPAGHDGSADKKPGPPEPSGKKIDPFRLPADAVLVVYDQVADVLKAAPRYVLVTAEKWKEMEAELIRLRALPDAPATPSDIRIKGKVEGNVAALQVTFAFTTDRPNVLVLLNCGLATSTGATMDGRPADLRHQPGEGYSVRVAEPKTGGGQVTLELLAPLTARGAAGRELVLDLPRAATTYLELTLPPGSKDVHLGEKMALAEKFLRFEGGVVNGPLGEVDKKLELTWKGANAAPGPALSARGLVQVHVEDRRVFTEAELTLQPLGGPARDWLLLTPPQAEVKVGLDEGRFDLKTQPRKDYALHTLRLKEPSEEAFKVTATVVGEALKPGAPASVGPFLVLGAPFQKGDVVVSSTAAGLRVDCRPRGDLRQRELTDEERRHDGVEAFSYARSSALPKQPPASAAGLALLDLEAEAMRRQVEVRSAAYALRLQRDEAEEWRWQLTATLEVKALWPGADRLTLQLPAGWEYDDRAGPTHRRVRSIQFDAERREVVVRLNRGGADALEPFPLKLQAVGPKAGPEGPTALGLPQLLDAVERGAPTVTAAAPDELELRLEGDNPSLELTEQARRRLSWRPGPAAERLPEKLRLGWGAALSRVNVNSEADVTLWAREVKVEQTLRCAFPHETSQLELQAPDGVARRLHVVKGGRLLAAGADQRTCQVGFAPGRECVLTLEYYWRPPEPGANERRLNVPLLLPTAAAQGGSKARVWADGGPLPLPAGGGWTEQDLEEVKGRDLPVLVVRSESLEPRLLLRLAEGAESPVTVLVERGLIRAQVGDGGVSVRASYLLRRLATRYLDLELPAPVAGLGLRVTLNGTALTPETLNDDGQPADGGRVARLRPSPEMLREPAVLAVSYQLSGGRGLFQTALRPPVIRGDSGRVPVRWLVALPRSWVVLGPESGRQPAWGLRGGLLAPLPTPPPADPELERRASDSDPPDEAEAPPSLILDGVSGAPLTVVHAPQLAWVLGCSAALAALGLGLYLAARPGANGKRSGWVRPLLVLLIAGGVVCALFWPDATAAAAYGAEPGAAVLGFAFLVLWLLHARYRRQIVFLPSFSRARTGSSVSRPAPKANGEPSTVDAPRSVGSSLSRGEPAGG
jgi:hypothetical protein